MVEVAIHLGRRKGRPVGAHPGGDLLERHAELQVGGDRRAGGRADRGGRRTDVDAGVLHRHENAGADPDRHRAATTDDDGEAGFVVPVRAAHFRPCAAARSSSIAPARQSS